MKEEISSSLRKMSTGMRSGLGSTPVSLAWPCPVLYLGSAPFYQSDFIKSAFHWLPWSKCVPQFICWNSMANVVDWKWFLLDSGSLGDRTRAFKRGFAECICSPLPTYHERTQYLLRFTSSALWSLTRSPHLTQGSSDSQPPDFWEGKFLLFKLSNIGCFVRATWTD